MIIHRRISKLSYRYTRPAAFDSLEAMDDLDRKLRAAQRRRTMTLNRASLGRIEQDPAPVSGLAAISLVQQLTRECWALAGRETPRYSRHDMPVRFVPGDRA